MINSYLVLYNRDLNVFSIAPLLNLNSLEIILEVYDRVNVIRPFNIYVSQHFNQLRMWKCGCFLNDI
jgi:hypothetical protein